jgi:uncharacterized protein (TIGR02246 family)
MTPKSASFTEKDRLAIAALFEEQKQAWNRGDLDGFMAGYERSDALVFTSGAQIRRGFEETDHRFRQRYGGKPETMGKLDFELIEIRGLGADGAVVLGRWELRDTPQQGGGVFSVILERQSEGWKIVHDHTSAREQG